MSETTDRILKQKQDARDKAGIKGETADTGELGDSGLINTIKSLTKQNTFTAREMRVENRSRFADLTDAIQSPKNVNSNTPELMLITSSLEKISDDVTADDASAATGAAATKRLALIERKFSQLKENTNLTEEQIEIAQEMLNVTKRQVSFERKERLNNPAIIKDSLMKQLPSITGIITGILGDNVASMFIGGFVQDFLDSSKAEKEKIADQEENYMTEKANIQRNLNRLEDELRDEPTGPVQKESFEQPTVEREQEDDPAYSTELQKDIKQIEKNTAILAMSTGEEPSLEEEADKKARDIASAELLEDIAENTGADTEIEEKEGFLAKIWDQFGEVIMLGAPALLAAFTAVTATLAAALPAMISGLGIAVLGAAVAAVSYYAGKVINEQLGNLASWLTGGKYSGEGWLGDMVFDYFHGPDGPIQTLKRSILETVDTLVSKKDEFLNWLLTESPYTSIKDGLNNIKQWALSKVTEFTTWLTGKSPFEVITGALQWYYNTLGSSIMSFKDWILGFGPFKAITGALQWYYNTLGSSIMSFKDWILGFEIMAPVKAGIEWLTENLTQGKNAFVQWITENSPVDIVSNKIKEMIESIRLWVSDKFTIDFPDIDVRDLSEPIVRHFANLLPFGAGDKLLEKLGYSENPEDETVIKKVDPEETIPPPVHNFEDAKTQMTPAVTNIITENKIREKEAEKASTVAVQQSVNSSKTTNVSANKTIQAPIPVDNSYMIHELGLNF